MLGHLALEICDPVQLGLSVDVVESADTAEENARIKALAYVSASGIAAFSLDAALRIEGLPDDATAPAFTCAASAARNRRPTRRWSTTTARTAG